MVVKFILGVSCKFEDSLLAAGTSLVTGYSLCPARTLPGVGMHQPRPMAHRELPWEGGSTPGPAPWPPGEKLQGSHKWVRGKCARMWGEVRVSRGVDVCLCVGCMLGHVYTNKDPGTRGGWVYKQRSACTSASKLPAM